MSNAVRRKVSQLCRAVPNRVEQKSRAQIFAGTPENNAISMFREQQDLSLVIAFKQFQVSSETFSASPATKA